MLITRKIEFSASHSLRSPQLSEADNLAFYGPAANPHGHGHNYVVEVTLRGTPDKVTGMVMDLKELKEILNREVLDPFDHRFLNHEVKPFHQVIPTPENIAIEIWSRLAPLVNRQDAALHCVRLWETPDLYVEYYGELGAVIDVTRRYDFSASHRLHVDTFTELENSELFGKCNNPFGHGHNYELFVTARGPVDESSGRAFDPQVLDWLVEEQVLSAYRNTYMNLDVPEFASSVPTTENVATAIADRLSARWTEAFPSGVPRLRKILIRETDRNSFELIL